MAKLMTTWQNIAIPSLNADTRGATAAFRSAREGFTDWQSAVDTRATNQALQDLLDPAGNVSRDNLGAIQGRPGVNYADLLSEVRAAEIGQRAAAQEGRAVETHQNTLERHDADMVGINHRNATQKERFKAEMASLSAQQLRDKLAADVSRGKLSQMEMDRILQGKQAEATAEIDQGIQRINSASLPDREAHLARLMDAGVSNFKAANQNLSGDALNDALEREMPAMRHRIEDQLGNVEQDWRNEQREEYLSGFAGLSGYAHTPAMKDYMEAERIAAEAAIKTMLERQQDHQDYIADVEQAGASAFTIRNGKIVSVPKGDRASNAINTGSESIKGLAAYLLDGNTSDEAIGFMNKLVAASGGDRNVLQQVASEFKLGEDRPWTLQFWKNPKRQSDALEAAAEWVAQLRGEALSVVESGKHPAPEPSSEARLASMLGQQASNAESALQENADLTARVESLTKALEAEKAANAERNSNGTSNRRPRARR